MGYNFTAAANPLAIAEQEYATADTIMFTTFTSCIGVIAKKGTQLTAIHLVMTARDGTLFNQVTASRIIFEVLPANYDKVLIIGCTDLWKNPQNNVLNGFNTLRGQIKALEDVQIYNWTSGIYGAHLEGGDIEIDFG